MTETVHALSPFGDGETSMCGFAYDAHVSEGDTDAAGRFEKMRPGLRVTCPACCDAIREMRAKLKGLRLQEPRND